VIIALDGPAGAGKGTLGRRLAEHYGLAYLDTGALYRAVARDALAAAALSPDATPAEVASNASRIAEIAAHLDLTSLDDPGLRAEPIGIAASLVAGLPPVRAALLRVQHRFAHEPPNGRAGAVLDGRDIGTVVCPDADVKIFLTASVEARADRRAAQLAAAGARVDRAAIRQEIVDRDARDAQRAAAPMKPADDAVLLDTTPLDIDAAFEAARKVVEAALARKRNDAPGP
jgi:cytidylate kinase